MTDPPDPAAPPVAIPLLIFDGDCGFCRGWIARWRRATGDRVEYAPHQQVAARFPEIPLARFQAAVQLIEPGGRWSQGAEAVFRALSYSSRSDWPLWLYENVPGFSAASEFCYRFVASHRSAFTRLTRWIWGEHVVPPGDALTSGIFVRLLAVVYGIAFVSFSVQILGLVGSHGILPARELLQGVREHYGAVRYWFVPTLSWLDAGDGFLLAQCAAGMLLAVLLALGIAPVLCLAGMWALYLSLASVSQDFLWFQWDSLLLEAGFVTIFLAPWRWLWRLADHRPARAPLWLLRWLLFRLMFSSAVVKLASGDPTWRHLTALRYHYETQPLPPWTAWYAHHLPGAFQSFCTGAVFVIEGLLPFFFLAPRRIRFAAGVALAAFQALIFVTGNYCFFNLLTIALCVLLLDDGVWPRWRWLRPRPSSRETPASRGWPAWVVRPVTAALVLLSLVPFFGAFRRPVGWLGPLPALYQLASPLRIVDSYGLFAVMTTRRPEIIVAGSNDGLHWEPYEFRCKPGDVTRRPGFVAPHQPRLDWQLWFAALSDVRQEPWFLAFCQRLLEGSRPVLSLLAKNPFPEAPPKLLRAEVYDYRFTDPAKRRATGAWWRREPLGLYCPVLTLRDGHLAAATPS